MKRLLIIIAVLLALVAMAFIAPTLLDDPGYVLLDIGRWRIEMSVLVLVGVVLLIWVVLSIASGLFRLPGRAARRLRQRRARKQMETGLLALTEGDWERAEKSLARALSYRSSTVGLLAAARAAQGRADPERRDAWLALADSRFGKRHFVTGLARARLLIGEGRIDEAIPVLEELHLRKRRHAGVLRLLLQAYQEQDRWREVRYLIKPLQKAGVIDRDRADELTGLAAARELGASSDIGELEAAWRDLRRRLRKRPEVVEAMARRAIDLGRPDLGEPALRALIDNEPHPDALRLYAYTDDSGRAGRIRHCERWLDSHPEDGALQLTLGMLYLDDRQYDRAQELLEQAVRRQPESEAYAALGRVLDRAGRLEAAAQCYRNALRLKSGRAAEPLLPPAGEA